MSSFEASFRGKRVLVTGHTGFKGTWLSRWLTRLGAEVTGFSLPAEEVSLFRALRLDRGVSRHVEGDICDSKALSACVRDAQPHFVFHLAAQPLVRQSYREPVRTYAVNVIGTINLLEALRSVFEPCAAVFITTDKVYENREWLHGYREEDPLGGYDPYSSSKAAAELAISSYRRSFFNPADLPARNGPGKVAVASARAGNVIGGGDWAADRIVPDCMRALAADSPIRLRNPDATRPWQHVLEPLGGYLRLAADMAGALETAPSTLGALCSAFNFGPPIGSNQSVRRLVEEVLKSWPGAMEETHDPRAVHEAGRLHLSIDKAFHLLRWTPAWDFTATVARTTEWYKQAHADPRAVAALTDADIGSYEAALSNL